MNILNWAITLQDISFVQEPSTITLRRGQNIVEKTRRLVSGNHIL